MFCINCFHPTTRVTNSRGKKKQALIWRRRHCPHCGATFTTHEKPSLEANQKVHLPSGKTTPFNLGQLILSIAQSFTHSEKMAKEYSLPLAETVEQRLSTQTQVITPEEIAAVTHTVLRPFDELAALQYAAQHRLVTSIRRRGRPSTAWHGPQTDESPSR
jgi:transcriptional repressor NrdR